MLSWQVEEKDWEHWRLYDHFIEAAERLIMRTNTGAAPWAIVEGEDANYRAVTVATAIRDALRKRLDDAEPQPEAVITETAAADEIDALIPHETVLSSLDLSRRLEKKDYKAQLKYYHARLNQLQHEAYNKKISTIALFEGPDAAGKGGAIRKVVAALDPHHYSVIPFGAPDAVETAHHYLWRFWRILPRAGNVLISDRSWYGRVLVERIEGFADEREWRRAYAEINDFEEQLIEHGIILMKYWIQISKEEQLARFQVRAETPHKRWKLTDEDWRNREKWDLYQQAAHDMVQYTSTHKAPWVLVEGDDKRFARIKVLKSLCQRMEALL